MQKKFSKLIVTLIVLLNVIFTAAILFIFYRTGAEPTTIIISWFAFTTGELMLLAGIKVKDKGKEERMP